MKRIVLITCCLLLLFSGCAGQREKESGGLEASRSNPGIGRYLSDLTGADLAGRRAGSPGEAWAGWYLASFLQKSGLLPCGDQGTYFQSFQIGNYEPILVDKRMTLRLSAKNGGSISENILGFLPGQSEEIIIVSAHYDHLGVIADELHPGANDNASGVAVLLELINALRQEKPRYSVLFAFWGAEETGLLGSRHFCSNPALPLADIKCVFNLDSVGRLQSDKVLLGWKTKSSETAEQLLAALSGDGWSVRWETDARHNSDHASFAAHDVAGFTLLSPGWLEDNHTPRDNGKSINITPLNELVQAIKKALLA